MQLTWNCHQYISTNVVLQALPEPQLSAFVQTKGVLLKRQFAIKIILFWCKFNLMAFKFIITLSTAAPYQPCGTRTCCASWNKLFQKIRKCFVKRSFCFEYTMIFVFVMYTMSLIIVSNVFTIYYNLLSRVIDTMSKCNGLGQYLVLFPLVPGIHAGQRGRFKLEFWARLLKEPPPRSVTSHPAASLNGRTVKYEILPNVIYTGHVCVYLATFKCESQLSR